MKDDLKQSDDVYLREKKILKEIEDKKMLLEKMKQEETKLDNIIKELNNDFQTMIKEEDFQKFGYITHNDLKNLVSQDSSMNLIAVKAPQGTSFEIPDPDEIEKLYKIAKQVRIYFFRIWTPEKSLEMICFLML